MNPRLPRHRFGQNFMIDQNLVRLVAEAGHIAPGELVIEVGPGTGTLTEELLGCGARVLAVEIDRDLAELLRRRLGDRAAFRLIEGDAMAGKHGLNEELAAAIRAEIEQGHGVKLVANLPYNIASPLVIELLAAGVGLLAFTVQKEVAERLRATPGGGEYGGLSIMAQLLADVEVLRALPAEAFWPAPKIASSLVRMARRDQLGPDARAFSVFLQRIFAARRKTMRKGLAQMELDAERLLGLQQIDPMLRPEDIAPEQFLRLFRASLTEAKGRTE